MIRNQTGLSYDCAQETIHSVLSYVSSNFSRLDRNIPALMCELELSSSELLKEPGEVSTSSDSKGKQFDILILLDSQSYERDKGESTYFLIGNVSYKTINYN